MKKMWLLLPGVLIILIVCIYIFIPSNFHIQQTVTFNVPDGAVKRLMIQNTSHWNKWWPGVADTSQDHSPLRSYRYNNSTYTISDIKYNSLTLSIHKNGFEAIGSLILIPGNTDSSYVLWDVKFSSSSSNPLKKVQAYFTAKKINKEMNAIVDAARSFFSSPNNIYGTPISKASVTDSILISTSGYSAAYPSVDFIYGMIDELNTFAASQSARVTGFPMLNIDPLDSGKYLTRVALPVDRKLNSSGNISYKWMLGGGNILIAEVKGGPSQIERTFHQVENYVNDYQRVAPAIPFLSLVTDRRKEPDSSRWITRICYPVM